MSESLQELLLAIAMMVTRAQENAGGCTHDTHDRPAQILPVMDSALLEPDLVRSHKCDLTERRDQMFARLFKRQSFD